MKTNLPKIPVFKLYGENQVWPTPDLLHCESIPKRSSVHHWEIQLHRHADLFQLLYVERGEAEVEVEGQRTQILEATIQVIPPLCVHGFQFSENIEGYVLTLAAPLVARLEEQLNIPLSALASAGRYPVKHDRRNLSTLLANLLQEYEGTEPSRDLVLQSLVNVLMVWISRRSLQNSMTNKGAERNNQYLVAFIRLVESHYREHLSIETFAHRIGLSSVHLNTLCRQLAGQTALQIVHQRLLLEAKRNLIYTAMNINQLSDSLGFNDPTYFSRFFRRLAGMPPLAFRKTAPPARSDFGLSYVAVAGT